MSTEPDIGKVDEAREAEKQVSTMQDQLSKEVASWSQERRYHASDPVIASPQPAIQRPSPRLTKKARAAPPPGQSASVRGKPFRMSYDGMTQAEYTRYLFGRGVR
jgi:hypothetical protein